MQYTKDEALAFIDAIRMTIAGKVGFRWMTEKLAALGAYVESVAAENERLHAYLDATGGQADFEAFAAGSGGASPGQE